MTLIGKVIQRGRDLLPITGLHFDRPIVILQSDDWGRIGLRDREGLDQLRSAGLALGERPYDLYSLETAEDLDALRTLLKRHQDASGRNPVLGMNFIVANLDFGKMRSGDFRQIQLLPLADGLPQGWHRPGLLDGYRNGIAEGVFAAALHGSTHFCPAAMEREIAQDSEHAALIRVLWQAGTPYIHWRMPWIGYEYWDSGKPGDERFPSADEQLTSIGCSVGAFAKIFATLPHSACAPGYRADENTHRAWAQHGIHVAQNGPGTPLPPHFDRYEILNLSRTVEFEPCTDAEFSVQISFRQAEKCFALGLPAIVSVHSINFHSTVCDFRSKTILLLDQLLSLLESAHPDLLYLQDEDLYQLAIRGRYDAQPRSVTVSATKKKFKRTDFTKYWKD